MRTLETQISISFVCSANITVTKWQHNSMSTPFWTERSFSKIKFNKFSEIRFKTEFEPQCDYVNVCFHVIISAIMHCNEIHLLKNLPIILLIGFCVVFLVSFSCQWLIFHYNIVTVKCFLYSFLYLEPDFLFCSWLHSKMQYTLHLPKNKNIQGFSAYSILTTSIVSVGLKGE